MESPEQPPQNFDILTASTVEAKYVGFWVENRVKTFTVRHLTKTVKKYWVGKSFTHTVCTYRKSFFENRHENHRFFMFSLKSQKFTKAILLCTTVFIFRKKLNFMVRSLLRKKMIAFFIEIFKIGWMRCTFRLFFLK